MISSLALQTEVTDNGRGKRIEWYRNMTTDGLTTGTTYHGLVCTVCVRRRRELRIRAIFIKDVRRFISHVTSLLAFVLWFMFRSMEYCWCGWNGL